MHYKKIIDQIATNCFCAEKHLPELIMYEIKRMGFNEKEIKAFKKEIESKYKKEVLHTEM
jgi:hypothetical protein